MPMEIIFYGATIPRRQLALYCGYSCVTVRRTSPAPVNAPVGEMLRINDDRTEEKIDLD